LFPARVRALVLDGAVDPDTPALQADLSPRPILVVGTLRDRELLPDSPVRPAQREGLRVMV
jgi:hypothetical protein